jgi:hypothetical protein
MTKMSRLVAAAALLLSAAPVLAAGPLRFFPLTNAPSLVGNASRDFQVQGKCGIPVNAKAVAVNATIVGPNSDGYITLYPSGTAWPGTANLTFKANEPALGNGAIVPLSTNANDLTIFLFQSLNTQHANVVVDGTGYFCSVDVNGACIP